MEPFDPCARRKAHWEGGPVSGSIVVHSNVLCIRTPGKEEIGQSLLKRLGIRRE